MSMTDPRLAIVVLTYNRRRELLRTLDRLAACELPVWLVDNASTDATAEAVARCCPAVRVLRLPRNLGAAGRNCGIAAAGTRYVACCDDDCWWAPGAPQAAADLLDAQPRLAALTARVLVGPERREDPASRVMAASPLPALPGLPGSAVAGLLAGACVFRREAFLAVGGYEPRLFLGGEEALLALDLLAAGWQLGYVPALVVHHYPSCLRDTLQRRRLLLRNALWCAWLRRPLAGAAGETLRRLREAIGEPHLAGSVLAALGGLPWVLRRRRVVPPQVEALLRLLEQRTA